MASSSSPRNWVYDVFPSFSGKDVRVTFMGHFLKELELKLITAFIDNDIERGQSLDPELKKAIKGSRIAVVVFSKNYASSTWCLNELVEIVQCKEKCGQTVIPVFYGLDPSHVRKQTGDFGSIFDKTCEKKPEDVISQWKEALTNVANTLGYHSVAWYDLVHLLLVFGFRFKRVFTFLASQSFCLINYWCWFLFSFFFVEIIIKSFPLGLYLLILVKLNMLTPNLLFLLITNYKNLYIHFCSHFSQ